jgi:hypothetical protein
MRKKAKFNPQLLNEELKKFKLLSEYDFYQEEKTVPTYEKPLILNDLEEAENSSDDIADGLAADLGLDEKPAADEKGGDEQPSGEENPTGEKKPVSDEEGSDEENSDEEGDLGDMDFGDEEAPIEDASNDVEVDVTSLVKGSEEAKASADRATQNTEQLLQKLSDLEARIARMDAVNAKIEDLEKEIIKRNPTPVEKLEMRSLSSFPYSQKLTDYWADKEGAYDVMGKENEPKEYTLTQDDVDTTYSEPDIKKSFTVNPEDFEEEDI